nr:DUF4829 domain-containing protein [Priestia taiwanensis]
MLSILVVLCIAVIGCTKENDTKENNTKENNVQVSNQDPKQVVQDYFTYKNEKNKEKVLAMMTSKQKDTDVGLDNLQEIKLLSIREDTTEYVRNSYLSRQIGQGMKAEDMKVYEIMYEVAYKDKTIGPQVSGTYSGEYYFVIREKEGEKWLIDEMGVF